jgi:hypothetical protein
VGQVDGAVLGRYARLAVDVVLGAFDEEDHGRAFRGVLLLNSS